MESLLPWGAKIAPYFGLIKGPIPLSFDGHVMITLPCLKLVDHSEPLFLIGMDILHSERLPHVWDFAGFEVDT